MLRMTLTYTIAQNAAAHIGTATVPATTKAWYNRITGQDLRGNGEGLF
jgi:hypothetical protein